MERYNNKVICLQKCHLLPILVIIASSFINPMTTYAQLHIRDITKTEQEDNGPRYDGKSFFFNEANLDVSLWYYKDQTIMLVPAGTIPRKNYTHLYGFYDVNGIDTSNLEAIDIKKLKAYKGEYTDSSYIDSADRISTMWYLIKDIYPEPIFTPRAVLDGAEFIIRKASRSRPEYRLLLEDKEGNMILFVGKSHSSGFPESDVYKKVIEGGKTQYVHRHHDRTDTKSDTFYMMTPIHSVQEMIGRKYKLVPAIYKNGRNVVMRRMEGGEYYIIEGPLTCTDFCFMPGPDKMEPCLVFADSNGIEYFEEIFPDSSNIPYYSYVVNGITSQNTVYSRLSVLNELEEIE